MMRYNSRPPHTRRRHRMNRGWYGFPWFFFGFIWLANAHSWHSIIPGLLFLVLFVIGIIYFLSNAVARNQPQQSYSHPAYQEPPYYQPTNDNHSYDQGYQAQEPQPAGNESTQNQYYTPAEQVQEQYYQEYEEPKADYPQQMPPM